LESFSYKDSTPDGAKAISIRHDQGAITNPCLATPAIVGESCPAHAGCRRSFSNSRVKASASAVVKLSEGGVPRRPIFTGFWSRGARPSDSSRRSVAKTETSRRKMFSTSSVQPRWVTEISFNGLTRRNFSRTSSGGMMMVAADVSRL